MRDKEKVELGIKACWSEYFSHKCFDCPYVSDRNDRKCVERLGTDALALLKEQEAVEPILKREGRNKYCNDYVCRICDQELTYGQNYCSDCGQAVKWNPDCEDCKPEDIRECTICRQR